MYILFSLRVLFKPICFRAAAMDNQPAPLAAGSPASSTSSWHSAFDPPSETISPKHDKKRSKDVGSKKSKKKKKKKKKSKTTSSNLQETQTAADFDDPVFDLLCKSKADSPATPVDSVKYEGRGVAKMMVRSGLRCPCHYVRRHLCPLKLLADEFGFTQSASSSI